MGWSPTLLQTYAIGWDGDIAGCEEAAPARTRSSGPATRNLTTSCRSFAGGVEGPE